jgi:hypothetical protein
MPAREDAAAQDFGARRIYYDNFAAHLLNAYNPNLLHPGLPYRWSAAEWRACLDMVADFGFTTWEFWLVPRLFCREALDGEVGEAFLADIRPAIEHAHARGLRVEMLCALATAGPEWVTLCPGLPAEWAEIQHLWDRWTKALPGLDIVGLFPGDPGACSRHGCTAETYIDRCCDIAALVKRNLPEAEIELHTWGPPFFGWGLIQGPEGWQGEFIKAHQAGAWTFSAERAERSMRHLLARLPDYPDPTSVAVNLGFNPDGNPQGEQDARPWIAEIARTHPVQSWDFSLTEGENNVVPHYRLERLFERRRFERANAPYRGGICFTMSPLLNQLSLYASARSFTEPEAAPDAVAGDFCAAVLGPQGRDVVPYLPLFEVVRDWGNYHVLDLDRESYHRRLRELCTLLDDLAGEERDTLALHPGPAAYREELLWFARLFRDLSAPGADLEALGRRYWERVYGIYDHLPAHVDSRARHGTAKILDFFRTWTNAPGPIAGKWKE